jgi:hypothetical protein
MTAVKRRCACRVTIEAEPDERSVSHALRVHYSEIEHRDWRERQELEAEKVPAPTLRLVVGRRAGDA